MKRKSISLKVNGIEQNLEIEARTTLLDMVRDQFGLTGAKLGCDMQVCGNRHKTRTYRDRHNKTS